MSWSCWRSNEKRKEEEALTSKIGFSILSLFLSLSLLFFSTSARGCSDQQTRGTIRKLETERKRRERRRRRTKKNHSLDRKKTHRRRDDTALAALRIRARARHAAGIAAAAPAAARQGSPRRWRRRWRLWPEHRGWRQRRRRRRNAKCWK